MEKTWAPPTWKTPAAFPLSHSSGCCWLSCKITVRKTGAGQNNTVIGLLIACLVVIWIGKSIGMLGFLALLLMCVAAFGGFLWYKSVKRRNQIGYLHSKYEDEALAQRILEHRPWEGQTSQQLVDSLGDPVSIDKKVLKTRKREIWKYNQRGTNRYKLRITLDDDIVVGWDEKN